MPASIMFGFNFIRLCEIGSSSCHACSPNRSGRVVPRRPWDFISCTRAASIEAGRPLSSRTHPIKVVNLGNDPVSASHAHSDDPRRAGADGLPVLPGWCAAWGLADSRNQNLVSLAGGTLATRIERAQIRVTRRSRLTSFASRPRRPCLASVARVALGTHRTWRPGRTRFTSHSSRTGWADFSRIAFGARRTKGASRTGFAPHALGTSRPLQSCLSLRAHWAGWPQWPLWSDGTLLSGNALQARCSWRSHRAGPAIAPGNQQ